MLPKKIHRSILNLLKLKDFAKEENLNLLDITDIKDLLKSINSRNLKLRYDYLVLYQIL